MSIFEKALTKVVEHMLAQKNIEVEDESLKLLMARKMGDKITDIAKMTSDGGNHAGRTKPGYFDLERTFLRMNIMPEDLRAEVKANAGKPKPKIDLPDPKTSTREHHTAAKPMLGATSSKEMAKHPNIPSFIGPFPGPHSYKETPIIAIIDKDYVEAREQMALKRLNEQNAVNRLHLSRKPTVSLFNEPCSRFDLIDVEPPKRPSYLDALMPRDQTYKTDIYDTKDSITHQALKNPFFMEPKSPGARKTPFHVDLGIPLKKDNDPKDIDMDDPYNMDPMIVRNPFSVEPKPSGNEPKDIDMDELFNMKPMAAKNPFVMEPKPAGTAKTPFHVDLGMSREKDNDPNYSDMDELFNMQPMKVNNPFLMEPKPAGTPKTPFHVDLGMARDGEDIDMDDLFDISKVTKEPSNVTPKELALGDILEKKTDLNLVKDPPQILNTDEIIEIVDSPETPETTEEETKQNAFKAPLTEQENIAKRKREENVEQASTSGSGKRIREKSHRKSSRSEKKHKKQEKSSKVSKSNLNLEKVSQRFDTADPSKKPKTIEDSSNSQWNLFPTGKATDVSQEEENKENVPISVNRAIDVKIAEQASTSGSGIDSFSKKSQRKRARSERKLKKQEKYNKKSKTDFNLGKVPQILDTEDSPKTANTTKDSSKIQQNIFHIGQAAVSQVKKTKESLVNVAISKKRVIAEQKREEKVAQASSSGSGKENASKKAKKYETRSEKKQNKDVGADLNLAKVPQMMDTADPPKKSKRATSKGSARAQKKGPKVEENKKNVFKVRGYEVEQASTSVSGSDNSGKRTNEVRTRSTRKQIKDSKADLSFAMFPKIIGTADVAKAKGNKKSPVKVPKSKNKNTDKKKREEKPSTSAAATSGTAKDKASKQSNKRSSSTVNKANKDQKKPKKNA